MVVFSGLVCDKIEAGGMGNYEKSTAVVIYQITGKYMPDVANAINEVCEKYPEIDKKEFLAVAFQESSFNKNLIKNGDYGLFQVHLTFWQDKYDLDRHNVMDVRVNTYVAAEIWLWANEDYGRYCGTKKNVKYYRKKLAVIKRLMA